MPTWQVIRFYQGPLQPEKYWIRNSVFSVEVKCIAYPLEEGTNKNLFERNISFVHNPWSISFTLVSRSSKTSEMPYTDVILDTNVSFIQPPVMVNSNFPCIKF